MSESASIEPEALLRESTWLQALAEGIVHDEHAAEDVVQATFLRALTHPPRSAGALRAWLGQVTRRFAYRTGDRARWSRRREEAAARAEAEPSAADLVTRASLHRAVVDAVLALDEPQRATVLMRFFEDLPPREIAKRHGVPVATVRSRLRRALDRLRETLDRTAGGREAWMSGLGITAAPIAAAAGGAGAGTATVTTMVLATKAKFAAAAAILLFAGVLGWRWVRPAESPSSPEPGVSGSRSGSALAAAQPARATVQDEAAATRRIVPRHVAEQDDRTRSGYARLIGQAVDDDTGEPLEGAEVTLSRTTDTDPPVRTATAADGRFALPKTSYLDPGVDRFVIAAPDHVRWDYASPGRGRTESRISGRDIDFGTIRIERGTVVTGRVLAAGDRHAIAGARLFLRTRLGWGPVDGVSPVGETGKDGGFELSERLGSVPEHMQPPFLIAVHPTGIDWVRVVTVKGQKNVGLEILARDGVSCMVRVVDVSARPLSDVIVLAVPSFEPLGDDVFYRQWPDRPAIPPADSPLTGLASRILGKTGSEGSVSFSGLPEGRDDPWSGPNVGNRITFYAFREGFENGRAVLDFASRPTALTIELKPVRERAITGVVRDESGAPIAGASVGYVRREAVLTNAAGEYRVRAELPRAGMPSPPIAATATGFAYAMRYATVAPGGDDPTLDFRLMPNATVRVRVVDESGRPLPRISLSLSRQAEGRVWSLPDEPRSETAEDGTCVFAKADSGEWSLSVHPGEAWEMPRPRPVSGGESIEVVLHPKVVGRASVTAEIVIESTGEAAAPAAAAILPAQGRRWSGRIETETSLGRVSARNVPPGTWKLMVAVIGYAVNDQEFTVRPEDEEVRLRIGLVHSGVLVARVVLDGIPAESRPEQAGILVLDQQARWVTAPGKAAPGAPRGSGRADASNDWTCRFEELRPNVLTRVSVLAAGMIDERFVRLDPGEEKTMELRPRIPGTAKLSTSRKVAGDLFIEVGDDAGGWHHLLQKSVGHPESATLELTRPPGSFRWRVKLWPVDETSGPSEPKVAEGEATIEAGKMTAIRVELPE